MKNKYLVITMVVLVVIITTYYFLRPHLEPLPIKESPSPSGLYSNVPLFERWEWKEGKNNEGDLVYRIKMPPNDEFVNGLEPLSEFQNNIIIYIYEPTNDSSENISTYYKNNEDEFLSHLIVQVGNSLLSRYNSHLSVDRGGVYKENLYYLLTRKNILLVRVDYDPECLGVNYDTSKDFRQFDCQQYYQIYLPIVEKALSTLEIPDYVDDRGFATSSEVKLLPDELRIYEVR